LDIIIAITNAFLKNLNRQFSSPYLASKFMLLLLFKIFIAHKVVELFSCTHCFEVRDFLLKLLSLLDRVSAHQASLDTSTKPHLHQIIKTPKTNTKTPKTPSIHLFQDLFSKNKHQNTKNTNKNNYYSAIFRSKPSFQARLAKKSPQITSFQLKFSICVQFTQN